ncbi:hypothetical protein G5B31_11495 [Rhodobacter sp. SGA-6-6]|uniref:hypothetical protein n=1 Tax=Rhodobacter sp. SGA-6-6 TaxID=2710882 RepID=UPI0013ED70A0|nr:hypothetical protein [Rhodobacter sp. SGA-6-6]NGM46158.1 hypothetical protein [Rhodobacter sp. SGA-6-6]
MPVVTRLYANYEDAAAAVDRIDALAIPRVEASIIGGESLRDYRDMRVETDPVTGEPVQVAEPAPATATGTAMGAALGGGAGLLAGLGLIAIPGLGPLVAAGWLVPALAGVTGGALAGGTIGALVDLGIPEEEAPLYSETFRRGGIAVSVRFPEEQRATVENALAATSAYVLPDLRRRYEAEGWRG